MLTPVAPALYADYNRQHHLHYSSSFELQRSLVAARLILGDSSNVLVTGISNRQNVRNPVPQQISVSRAHQIDAPNARFIFITCI